MQGLAPASPVLHFPVSPGSNDRPQGLKLLARSLFLGVDRTAGCIALCACFVPRFRIVSSGLVLSLSDAEGCAYGLLLGDEFSHFARVDPIHQAALLGHLPGEMLSVDDPMEVADRLV